MKKIITIFTISSLMIVSSCGDCIQNVTGTVVDAATGQPIQGAHVHKESKVHDQANTDENGSFEIESISGGLFTCPPMTVIVSIDGYEAQTVKIDNFEHETIKLKQIMK